MEDDMETFDGSLKGALNSQPPEILLLKPSTQNFQNPLIKEFTLNHIGDPVAI